MEYVISPTHVDGLPVFNITHITSLVYSLTTRMPNTDSEVKLTLVPHGPAWRQTGLGRFELSLVSPRKESELGNKAQVRTE